MKYEYRLNDVPQIVEVLSEEIRQSPLTMRQIAERTRPKMNPQTVSRLYYKETRFPSAQTVLSLSHFFGFDVVLRRSNRPGRD